MAKVKKMCTSCVPVLGIRLSSFTFPFPLSILVSVSHLAETYPLATKDIGPECVDGSIQIPCHRDIIMDKEYIIVKNGTPFPDSPTSSYKERVQKNLLQPHCLGSLIVVVFLCLPFYHNFVSEIWHLCL